MANVLINENSMTAIADAIRAKNGSTTKYKPNEMAGAIAAISGGGITPTGTKNITTNGDHDVSAYATAHVAVPTGGVTPSGSRTFTENGTYDVTNIAEAVVNVEGSGGLTIEDIAVGNVTGDLTLLGTTINRSAFSQTKITSFTAPNLVNFNDNNTSVFEGCSELKTVHLDKLEQVGVRMFANCKSLQTVVVPATQSCIQNNTFAGGNIVKYDGYKGIPSFMYMYNLKVIILRSDTLVSLGNTNLLYGVKFNLYVPQSLVAEYESATNWSTLLSNANNNIYPIEGSEYEHYYADGTPIPTE